MNLFSLKQGQVKVTIVAAPIDPSKCLLYREEECDAICGKKLRWKLELKDVYRNPANLRDIRDQYRFSVNSDDITTAEKRSLCVILDDKSKGSYFLELSPVLSGSRLFTFFLDEKQLGRDSMV